MRALAFLFLTLAVAAVCLSQVNLSPTWIDRYNGPSNGYDDAGGMCADTFGSIYVAGTAPNATNQSSFAVIKYSNAGVRQWIARHSGAGGKAFQVAVDSQLNVFASGYRWSSPSYEEFIAKFDASGQELWSRRLDGRPTKLLVDASANVYVCGTFNDGYDSDWSVIKLSPAGKTHWEVRYDDPFFRNDTISNAMFDAAGNLVVVGTAGIDSGSAPGDVVVAKYNPEGALLWRRFFTVGATTHEFADDMGFDSFGNIYVIGGAAASGSIYEQASDLWLKYSSNGALIGQALGGPAPNSDVGTGAVDAAGNFYHVTFSRLSKYSAAGVLLWQWQFTSPPLGITIPLLRLTSSNEIVVAGTSYDGTFNGDYLIYGFSPDGALKWFHRYNGPINGDDTVEGLVADTKGSVFVTGTSWNNYSSIGGSADDIVTLKFIRPYTGSR